MASRKEQYYSIYSIRGGFKSSILDIIKEKSSEAELQRQRRTITGKKVIENFFEYGKYKEYSGTKEERRIILEEIS